MASRTKKTKAIRKNKKSNAGKKRKTANRNKGTTQTKEALFGESASKDC